MFCKNCGNQAGEGLKICGNCSGADIQPSANQDIEFEQMMEQRIRENFAAPVKENATISDERLKEMSKKLPSWSLEPPYSFIK